MKLGISGKKISSTVLISMTDVIFLLLIFLLIASNFAAQPGLPFTLPGSTSQQRQTPQVLHVQYQNDNRIDFMDGSYTIQTLGEALKNQFKSSDQVVRLSAQKDTPLQNIVSLMDIIREAGFERIFVATEPVNK